MLMNNKMKYFYQKDYHDCGIACLLTIFSYYSFNTTCETLIRQVSFSINGVSAKELVKYSNEYNFNVFGGNLLHLV